MSICSSADWHTHTEGKNKTILGLLLFGRMGGIFFFFFFFSLVWRGGDVCSVFFYIVVLLLFFLKGVACLGFFSRDWVFVCLLACLGFFFSMSFTVLL